MVLSRAYPVHLLFLLLSIIPTIFSSTIINHGRTLTINDINYYVGGTAVSRLTSQPDGTLSRAVPQTDGDIIPMTVMRGKKTTARGLEEIVEGYKKKDDVFQEGFLRATFLASDGDGQETIQTWSINNNETKVVMTPQNDQHNTQNSAIVTATLETDLPEGPYFVSARTGNVFKAFRLYPDHQLAFTEAGISDEEGGFMYLPAVSEGSMTKSVAVPSRLYYTPTREKPLAGLRLGVKDIFDMKGLRTSGGNRAYHDFYPARNATAPAIQRLVDLGAVFVGKMGTVQFANGDNPTADWVDFHCPFNPRGDGYQAPGGSSSGPAAGIASYDWLDIAVGSDTGGSMRNPGGMQGIFANRPSTGAISLDNAIPLSHVLDTAGVFARSAATWSRVVKAWYPGFGGGNGNGGNQSYTGYPKKIFYSKGSFPGVDTDAGALLEDFVVKLERFLGVERTIVDINARWGETHAPGTPDTITGLLNTTYAILTSVDQYRSLAQPFFADYAAKHNGRRPFINPGPLARWIWGQENGGDEAYTAAVQNKTVFKDWWETDGFGGTDNTTCSEGVYVYPYTTGKTQYRNEYFDLQTNPPLGFKDSRIANMAGTPDVVVPVGDVPYNSTVSLQTEYMPVTVSLVVARECDFMVADLVGDLEREGVLRGGGVKTGGRVF